MRACVFICCLAARGFGGGARFVLPGVWRWERQNKEVDDSDGEEDKMMVVVLTADG